MADTIPIVVARGANPGDVINRGIGATGREVVNVDTEKLRKNLTAAVTQVTKLVEAAESAKGALSLDTVQVALEVSGEGGVSMIGPGGSPTPSIVLTFKKS